jgi:hypothetical protein
MTLARITLAFALSSAALPAAPLRLDGRWNIKVDLPRKRVWWLELNGTATPAPSGWFTGAPGGQVDPIPNLTIKDGQVSFFFERDRNGQPLRQTYTARLVDGRLEGAMVETLAGVARPAIPFTGVRAPEIRDVDDGSWKPGQPVALFNGRDLAGWHHLLPDQPHWVVRDDVLTNEKGATELVSDARFWNFILRAEYRYPAHSNSGIALRGRYEIQINDDYGRSPSVHSQGAIYSRFAPKVNASRPPGEWQTLEIRLVGRQATVILNGQTVQDHQDVIGATAMAIDAEEDRPGPIVIQGDHGPVEFRTLTIVPLLRSAMPH